MGPWGDRYRLLHRVTSNAPLLTLVEADQHNGSVAGAIALAAFFPGVLLTVVLFVLAAGAFYTRSERAIPWIRGAAGRGASVLGGELFAGSTGRSRISRA